MLAFLGSVGSFLPGLFGKQISFGAAKTLGAVILVILFLGLASLGKCAYDKSVINDYEAGVQAKVANDTLAADRAADQATANQIAQFEVEQDRLEQAAANAARAHPSGAAGTVGPVSQSYYDNLPAQPKGRSR